MPGPAHEVVFLSGQVDDAATLAAALRPGLELVMLDSSHDGLAQIASYLGEHPGISAVHIVSHGHEGSVQLGNLWLGSENLAAHADTLARIGQAMEPGGDLLFYGCNLGAGQAGAAFLDQLSQATGADVAASNDPTGSAMFGGDWVLEAQRGSVTAETAFVAPALGSYVGLLAVSDENFDANGLTTSTSTSMTVAGGTWTFTSLDGATDMGTVNGTGLEYPFSGLSNTSGNRVFVWNYGNNGGFSNFSFGSTDSTNFDLNSFSNRRDLLLQHVGDDLGVAGPFTGGHWRNRGPDHHRQHSNISYTLGGAVGGDATFGHLTFGSAFDNVDESACRSAAMRRRRST